ncbi:MAG TPA: Dyp-type peroxidase [Reyranella sp.]|nr:Dyp-type peroxidase [Reyranella sp.]
MDTPQNNLPRGLHDDVWRSVQRGLVYPSPYAVFVTFFRLKQPAAAMTKARLGQILTSLRQEIHERFPSAHTTAILGVGFALWREMSASDGSSLPVGMVEEFKVFERPGTAFHNSAADLWFHIKSDNEQHCEGVMAWLRERLERKEEWADGVRTVFQAAATKSNRPDKRGGKVLGARFSENLNNATDPLTIQQQTIVGREDLPHAGASFVLAQRFVINWEQILSMAPEQIEDMVGRKTDDTLIPSREDRSHIKRARAQDGNGNTMSVLRLGLPFGHSRAIEQTDLLDQGASRRDEEGIYFAGYAKSALVLQTIMDRQIGETPGFMSDRLLGHVKANLGGFFYIPSLPDLGLAARDAVAESTSLDRFPGVDWSRLDRHFDQKSANGYMHYNHKEYLYRMATVSGADRAKVDPPSPRVLMLLAAAFSRWQDNWYFDRAQQEMAHLSVYLERYFGAEKAREVMALSIEERSGWTAKVLLGHLLVSDEYGFRGRRKDAKGNVYNGADTCHIDPYELIVGALPNLGLGQGKYLVDFAREDEQLPNFFDNLSYASGVGHIVPDYSEALRLGLGALTKQVAAQRDGARDAKHRRFYAGAVLALEGVQEHCRAFARRAVKMAKALTPGQDAAHYNLTHVSQRMNHLAEHPPRSMVEAAQLIFTLHSCVHHVGEPTAVGRLDQLLQPYFEADRKAGKLDAAHAQEIVDCFWIKVGEKLQLNRQFVEDHQPFGNLAMGGSSGNYPQGSSLNQWIQQVTVGGTVADDSPGMGKPAYNDVTMFCLRAARRLPLNAPCLSLRMRPDIPAELVHEAALAILSGGAHPILLSDEKVTPGLQQSGDKIGEGNGAGGSTPVAAKADGLWQTSVSLRDARDYACDGCYEPQLSGTSWFTLGGLTLPQVLEAALNQGKTWQSAGPVWFRGQRQSFTSEPPREIQSFEHVIELFFKHLRWMYAKQADGQISIFGRMNQVCPAPLLSVFINDCLKKGLDYYEGGPRYNVIAPCFTGLSTLIDSLWAIKAMVFDRTTAVTSLPELVEALMCDWGENMVEPFFNVLEGPARIGARSERYKRLRAAAMEQPRFGRGHADIDAFGDQIIGRVARTAVEVFTDPVERTAAKMLDLARKLGTKEHPFGGFQIQPGVGTFENYLDWGNMTGASADGRLSGDPLASDLSPAPSFGDLPIDHNEAPILKTMAGFSGKGVEAMWDGAPNDFNIRESFPVEALEQALMAFAKGRGSSIMTITCADPETYEAATQDPEKYDLLRARMGGWTEFFVTMFPAHQAQHQRRPFELPGDGQP